MSFRIGAVRTLLLGVSLAACVESTESPSAPMEPLAPPDEPAFAVSAFAPLSGAMEGGTAVTVTGFGFNAGTVVTFGETPAVSVRVVNPTLLYVVAPSHSVGEVDVVVANPDGQSATASKRYRYYDDSDGCPGCWDY
jgi:hypothetical protein